MEIIESMEIDKQERIPLNVMNVVINNDPPSCPKKENGYTRCNTMDFSQLVFEDNKRIVVVFGSAGSGKTSLINTLCDANEKLNDGGMACTMESKSFECDSAHGNSVRKFCFFDTMGLNTVCDNGDEEKTASVKLTNLLKKLNKEISLFIFVFRGIINNEQKKDYENFYSKKNMKTPILCVVNGLESEKNKEEWIENNKYHFERNNLLFTDIVGTTFIKNEFDEHDDNFKHLRAQSYDRVWGAIHKILDNVEVEKRLSTLKKKNNCTIL